MYGSDSLEDIILCPLRTHQHQTNRVRHVIQCKSQLSLDVTLLKTLEALMDIKHFLRTLLPLSPFHPCLFMSMIFWILIVFFCHMIVCSEALPAEIRQIQLTSGEQAWLAEHPVIEVGIMDAWPPMNYVDENGIPRGIGVDYLNAMNQRLGGVLKVVPASFKENLNAVKLKKRDVLMDITLKPYRGPFYHFTNPYFTISHLILGRKDGPYFMDEESLYGKTVALKKRCYTITQFRRGYPDIKIREYPDIHQCFEAVSRKEVDAYVGNKAEIIYLMEKEIFSNLKTMGKTSGTGVPLTMGVRRDWMELVGILDKALASLSGKEIEKIHQRWIVHRNAALVPQLCRGQLRGIFHQRCHCQVVTIRIADLHHRRVGTRTKTFNFNPAQFTIGTDGCSAMFLRANFAFADFFQIPRPAQPTWRCPA